MLQKNLYLTPCNIPSIAKPLVNIKKMNIKNLLLFLTLLLFSCKEKQQHKIESTQSQVEKKSVEPTKENSIIENKHCYIKEVFKRDEIYFISADYIDFLMDEKAIEKAKDHGEAEYDISENGDTIYFVYNDYYISNFNPKLRTLELSEQIKIELLDFSKNANDTGFKKVSVNKLIEEINSNPIIILSIKDGVVIEIKEQFTP